MLIKSECFQHQLKVTRFVWEKGKAISFAMSFIINIWHFVEEVTSQFKQGTLTHPRSSVKRTIYTFITNCRQILLAQWKAEMFTGLSLPSPGPLESWRENSRQISPKVFWVHCFPCPPERPHASYVSYIKQAASECRERLQKAKALNEISILRLVSSYKALGIEVVCTAYQNIRD